MKVVLISLGSSAAEIPFTLERVIDVPGITREHLDVIDRSRRTGRKLFFRDRRWAVPPRKARVQH